MISEWFCDCPIVLIIFFTVHEFVSLMMRLPTLLSLILHVAVADLREVVGYLGDSVNLTPGEPVWNISGIEWTILSNNTWIATYRHGEENIERFWRYKGRLRLNTSSGDLLISHLTKEDAIEYTVDLKNTTKESRSKIKLTVKQHLQKPRIQTLLSGLKEGNCVMVLQCSSPDEGAVFSWEIDPSNSTLFQFNSTKYQDSTLAASFSPNNEVKFTCNTSKNAESTSSAETVKCSDDKPKPADPVLREAETVQRGRIGLWVIPAFVLGFLLGIGIGYLSRGHLTREGQQGQLYQAQETGTQEG